MNINIYIDGVFYTSTDGGWTPPAKENYNSAGSWVTDNSYTHKVPSNNTASSYNNYYLYYGHQWVGNYQRYYKKVNGYGTASAGNGWGGDWISGSGSGSLYYESYVDCRSSWYNYAWWKGDSTPNDYSLPAISKTGYTQGNYKANSTSVYVAPGGTYSIWSSKDGETFARTNVTWSLSYTPNTYKITLNNQSATSVGTAEYYQKYDNGLYSDSACTTAISKITVPSRTGYTFGGYYTSQNGGGTQYIKADGTISATKTTFTAATTLYAKWTANTYTVTFDKQNGTGGNDNVTATYDSAMPSITPPTRTGYAFAGYYDATSDGTQYYTNTGASARTWNKTSNTKLYARWTAVIYTVTLNNQNATTAGTTKIYEHYKIKWSSKSDASDTITSITMPTRTGYTFKGYNTKSDGTGTTQIADSGSISAANDSVSSATTWYAKWQANTYRVTLNSQGGSGGTDYVDAIYASTMPNITLPTRAGYTFAGYYDNTSGGVQYYTATGGSARAWDKTSATELYARWTINTYTATFNPNGGSWNSNKSKTYNINDILTAPTDELTRTNFKSYTWRVKTASGNWNVNDTLSDSNGKYGDVTFEAQWLGVDVAVTFNFGGATGSPGTFDGNFNGAYVFPTITNTPSGVVLLDEDDIYWRFLGWWTTSSGDGVRKDYPSTNNIIDTTSAHTLYARWEEIKNTYIKKNGAWKNVSPNEALKGGVNAGRYYKVGGTWKWIKSIWVKVNGVWKENITK